MATFGTFVSGQVLTAAELNTAGAFIDYTPTWTQSATITKTTNWARYTQLGKLVQGSIKMTASSAGTADNKILVGLPVAASANNFLMGTMNYFDTSSSAAKYPVTPSSVLYESSTTVAFTVRRVDNAAGVYGAIPDDKKFGENFSSGTFTGITVASGDIIYIQFSYEAA